MLFNLPMANLRVSGLAIQLAGNEDNERDQGNERDPYFYRWDESVEQDRRREGKKGVGSGVYYKCYYPIITSLRLKMCMILRCTLQNHQFIE